MRLTTVEGLAAPVGALTALRPDSLSVEQLQAAIPMVTALVDRLGGWTDAALGELASRGGDQVPAADGDGRQVPAPAWLRDATGCGGEHAGKQVRLAERLRSLPELTEAVLHGRVGRKQAAVLTVLVARSDPSVSSRCRTCWCRSLLTGIRRRCRDGCAI